MAAHRPLKPLILVRLHAPQPFFIWIVMSEFEEEPPADCQLDSFLSSELV